MNSDPVSLVTIATNGDIEGVDTLKSTGGGVQKLGVNIFENSLERKRVILGFILFTGYILIIQYLGFFIASLLFVTSMHIYLSNRKINLK